MAERVLQSWKSLRKAILSEMGNLSAETPISLLFRGVHINGRFLMSKYQPALTLKRPDPEDPTFVLYVDGLVHHGVDLTLQVGEIRSHWWRGR